MRFEANCCNLRAQYGKGIEYDSQVTMSLMRVAGWEATRDRVKGESALTGLLPLALCTLYSRYAPSEMIYDAPGRHSKKVKAIGKVRVGAVWLDRSLTARMLSQMSNTDQKGKTDPEAEKIASLTERELETVRLVCQGLKNKEIAAKLFISEATVRSHLTSILRKLGVSDRLELALYGYRHHLAKPPS